MNQTKLGQSFILFIIAAIFLAAPQLWAQADNNRVAVPLSDPSRPATVRAHLLNGSITVKAYQGKEVIVEAKVRDGEKMERHSESGGMKRIPINSTGLNVEAESNQVRISADTLLHAVDLTITVPVKTSLSLKTVNEGSIVVTGVDGEIDVDDVNGSVTLNRVSGSAVAHALNGRVLATFNRVDAKPMAFSSLNGDIDVSLPPGTKANLSMRTDYGEVFSDFDVQLQSSASKQVEDGRSHGGKYRVKIDKNVRGTINGGGPEIQLKNFNGNIYIRKTGVKE